MRINKSNKQYVDCCWFITHFFSPLSSKNDSKRAGAFIILLKHYSTVLISDMSYYPSDHDGHTVLARQSSAPIRSAARARANC